MEATARGSDFLEHYGVKGMKWGVRNESRSSRKERRAERKQAKFDAQKGELVLSKACKNGTEISVYKANPSKLQTAMANRFKTSRESLENFHQFVFADKDGRKIGEASFSQTSKTSYDLEWIGIKKDARSNGYARAALDGVISHAKDNGITELNLIATEMGRPLYESLGFQPQGDSYYQLKIDAQAKHAFSDSDLETLLDRMVKNVNQDASLNDLNHTDLAEDFLEHYGIKGMKWGVRRSEAELTRSRGSFTRSTPDPSDDKKQANAYKSRVSKGNTDNLSNDELRALNDRMQLEQKYSQLTAGENARKSSAGKKFVSDLATNVFKQQATRVANDQVSKQVGKVIKNFSK